MDGFGRFGRRRIMRPRIIALFITLAVLAATAPCRSENKDYLNTFEAVWKKVNEAYFDPAFGSLNWKDVHDGYRPQIARAKRPGAAVKYLERETQKQK
jgi:hypothetical protein